MENKEKDFILIGNYNKKEKIHVGDIFVEMNSTNNYGYNYFTLKNILVVSKIGVIKAEASRLNLDFLINENKSKEEVFIERFSKDNFNKEKSEEYIKQELEKNPFGSIELKREKNYGNISSTSSFSHSHFVSLETAIEYISSSVENKKTREKISSFFLMFNERSDSQRTIEHLAKTQPEFLKYLENIGEVLKGITSEYKETKDHIPVESLKKITGYNKQFEKEKQKQKLEEQINFKTSEGIFFKDVMERLINGERLISKRGDEAYFDEESGLVVLEYHIGNQLSSKTDNFMWQYLPTFKFKEVEQKKDIEKTKQQVR
jgi:hypothetical protein